MIENCIFHKFNIYDQCIHLLKLQYNNSKTVTGFRDTKITNNLYTDGQREQRKDRQADGRTDRLIPVKALPTKKHSLCEICLKSVDRKRPRRKRYRL